MPRRLSDTATGREQVDVLTMVGASLGGREKVQYRAGGRTLLLQRVTAEDHVCYGVHTLEHDPEGDMVDLVFEATYAPHGLTIGRLVRGPWLQDLGRLYDACRKNRPRVRRAA